MNAVSGSRPRTEEGGKTGRKKFITPNHQQMSNAGIAQQVIVSGDRAAKEVELNVGTDTMFIDTKGHMSAQEFNVR